MSDQDWRFKDFKQPAGGGAYGATLAVPSSGFARANFQSQYGGASPTAVTAASRAIAASPSGTDWNATFRNNNPASPGGTNWQKTFPSAAPSPSGTPSPQTSSPGSNRPGSFSLGMDSSNYGSQLSLANTPASSFYRDRFANMDVTLRDRQMYGAGDEFGFHTY